MRVMTGPCWALWPLARMFVAVQGAPLAMPLGSGCMVVEGLLPALWEICISVVGGGPCSCACLADSAPAQHALCNVFAG